MTRRKGPLLCVIAFAVLGVVAVIVGFAMTGTKAEVEKENVILGSACWPYYSFESATKEAVTIVYGKVVDKGEMQGTSAIEYQTDVTVKVIEWIKGDMKSDKITFLEAGGETETKRYLWDGMTPVRRGEKYVFFLTEKGAILNPLTLVPVTDGKVSTNRALLPEAQTMAVDSESDEIPVNDYLEAVREECLQHASKEE